MGENPAISWEKRDNPDAPTPEEGADVRVGLQCVGPPTEENPLGDYESYEEPTVIFSDSNEFRPREDKEKSPEERETKPALLEKGNPDAPTPEEGADVRVGLQCVGPPTEENPLGDYESYEEPTVIFSDSNEFRPREDKEKSPEERETKPALSAGGDTRLPKKTWHPRQMGRGR